MRPHSPENYTGFRSKDMSTKASTCTHHPSAFDLPLSGHFMARLRPYLDAQRLLRSCSQAPPTARISDSAEQSCTYMVLRDSIYIGIGMVAVQSLGNISGLSRTHRCWDDSRSKLDPLQFNPAPPPAHLQPSDSRVHISVGMTAVQKGILG